MLKKSRSRYLRIALTMLLTVFMVFGTTLTGFGVDNGTSVIGPLQIDTGPGNNEPTPAVLEAELKERLENPDFVLPCNLQMSKYDYGHPNKLVGGNGGVFSDTIDNATFEVNVTFSDEKSNGETGYRSVKFSDANKTVYAFAIKYGGPNTDTYYYQLGTTADGPRTVSTNNAISHITFYWCDSGEEPPGPKEFEVKKVWQDADGQSISMPDDAEFEIKICVYPQLVFKADALVVAPNCYTITEETPGGSVRFYVYPGEGFTVSEETSPEGYSAISGIGDYDYNDSSPITVTNKADSEDPGSKQITVEKGWMNHLEQVIEAPDVDWEISIQVGDRDIPYILSDSEASSVTFVVYEGEDVDIDEVTIPEGFEPSGLGVYEYAQLTDGSTITVWNMKDEPQEPGPREFTVRKVWQNANGGEIQRPAGVEFRIEIEVCPVLFEARVDNDLVLFEAVNEVPCVLYVIDQTTSDTVTFMVYPDESFTVTETIVPNGYNYISGEGTYDYDRVGSTVSVINRAQPTDTTGSSTSRGGTITVVEEEEEVIIPPIEPPLVVPEPEPPIIEVPVEEEVIIEEEEVALELPKTGQAAAGLTLVPMFMTLGAWVLGKKRK